MRDESLGRRRFQKTPIFEVADDAHNVEISVVRSFRQLIENLKLDFLAQSVFASKVSASKSVIYHGHRPGRIDIGLGKQPAAQQPNAERLKVGFTAQVDRGFPMLRVMLARYNDFATRSANRGVLKDIVALVTPGNPLMRWRICS